MLKLAVRDFKIEVRNMLMDLEENISRIIEHMEKYQQINKNYKIKQIVNSRAKKHI